MVKNFTQADFDPADYKNPIDYSERVTEPGLVLSMREIYNRYAAAGVDLLSPTFEQDNLDDSEVIEDPIVEEKTDLAYQVIQHRSRGLEREKRQKQAAQERRERQRNQRGRKPSAGADDTPLSASDTPPAPAGGTGSGQQAQE